MSTTEHGTSDGLEPYIDKATMEFHHDEHREAYVDKLTAAIEGSPDPTLSDGDVVRAFFDAYSDQNPERFAAIVAEDHLDHGHERPGRGRQGARDDDDASINTVGVIRYEIDALVDDGDGRVAAVWTAKLPGTDEPFKGLGVHRVRSDQLAETHHAVVGPIPTLFR